MSAYLACIACEEGRADSPDDPRVKEFAEHHASHGGLKVVPEYEFLSDYIANGFIDVDAPDREPLRLHLGSKPTGTLAGGQRTPFGQPGNIEHTARLHRSMRIKALATKVVPPVKAAETKTVAPTEEKPTGNAIDLSYIRPGMPFTVRPHGATTEIEFDGHPPFKVPMPLANAILRELLV